VITTVNRADQQAAYQALRRGVMDYDRRHGYRGAEAYVDMKDVTSDQDEELEEHLTDSTTATTCCRPSCSKPHRSWCAPTCAAAKS
jgi:membrane carboxypeptidase/penicillin-binding protein